VHCPTSDRATALIRSPAGWAAITAIAEALHARGQLTGQQVAKLCRAAYDGRQPEYAIWQEHWPPTLEQLRAGFVPPEGRSCSKPFS